MDFIIRMFVNALKNFPPQNVKIALDAAIDKLEEAVNKSNTKIDDKLVLPTLKWVREGLGIIESEGSGFEDK